MSRRVTAGELVEARAECQGCSWRAETRNGLALAARHHDRTGHVTRCETVTVVTYGDQEQAARDAGQMSIEDVLP